MADSGRTVEEKLAEIAGKQHWSSPMEIQQIHAAVLHGVGPFFVP
jgi:hypothetical protein